MELELALAVTLVVVIVITHEHLPAWFALAVAAVLLSFVLAAASVRDHALLVCEELCKNCDAPWGASMGGHQKVT
jgi:cobalamin biosynthesis protein CobD/CbiB